VLNKNFNSVQLRNNSTVFEELEVSIVDLTVTNAVLLLFLFLWNSPNMYTLVWKHTNKWRNICPFQICMVVYSAGSSVQSLFPFYFKIINVIQCTDVYSIIKENLKKKYWNFFVWNIWKKCKIIVYLGLYWWASRINYHTAKFPNNNLCSFLHQHILFNFAIWILFAISIK
jgi:hypothetical protein